jgi:hypothetical protein
MTTGKRYPGAAAGGAGRAGRPRAVRRLNYRSGGRVGHAKPEADAARRPDQYSPGGTVGGAERRRRSRFALTNSAV